MIVVTIYLADSSKLDTALNMYYRAVPLPLIFVSYAMNHVHVFRSERGEGVVVVRKVPRVPAIFV